MTHRFSLALLLALFLAPAVGWAQTTYVVTVAASTDGNPRSDPWSVVYYIGGEESAELTLMRGETYVFEIGDGATTHPFYISTSDVGGGAGVWNEGVEGNFATTGNTLTFTVPASAPDLLSYECGAHPRMGWQLNIVNPVANEDEAQPLALDLGAAFPNPFAERATLTLSLTEPQEATVEVFDLAGRRVAVLHDGLLAGGEEHAFTLGAAGLADGTYVVRVRAGEHTAERRVTLVR
jgi:hypothetical protein